MPSAAQLQLNEIKALVRKAKVETRDEVATLVKSHFDTVSWSALKDEWNRMNKAQREAVIDKLFVER